MKLLINGLIVVALTACSGPKKKNDVEVEPAYHAFATLKSFGSGEISGYVDLQENFGSLKYKVSLKGLPKNQKLALIFHSHGDCRSESSVGTMYLSEKRNKVPYLHRFTSDKKGEVELEGQAVDYSLNSSVGPVVGRSIVLHTNLNDFTGQYSGKFEKRIACGIIGVSKK